MCSFLYQGKNFPVKYLCWGCQCVSIVSRRVKFWRTSHPHLTCHKSHGKTDTDPFVVSGGNPQTQTHYSSPIAASLEMMMPSYGCSSELAPDKGGRTVRRWLWTLRLLEAVLTLHSRGAEGVQIPGNSLWQHTGLEMQHSSIKQMYEYYNL